MINIHFGNQANGPGKVVSYLLKGLDKAEIKYKTNQTIVADEYLLSLQDSSILYSPYITNAIIGPNICTLPYDNHIVMQQQYKKIIVPSQWVFDLYKRWLPENKIAIWAVGIDTDTYSDFSGEEKLTDCLVYFKRRDISDMLKITNLLSKHGQTFDIIEYGQYNESQFIDKLKKCKYGFVCDNTESQGIAIEEMLSTNLPLCVWDVTRWSDRGESDSCPATSIPYWSPACGEFFHNESEMDTTFTTFLNSRDKYQPRNFIIDNLSIHNQAIKLLELFD